VEEGPVKGGCKFEFLEREGIGLEESGAAIPLGGPTKIDAGEGE
jgi:hypothetical protein